MSTNIPARVAADAAQADLDLAALANAAATPAPAAIEPTSTEPTPPAPAPVPTAQPVDMTAEFRRMQQQFDTLQGRFNAVSLQNAELQGRVAELSRTPPAPAPAPEPTSIVTEQDRSEFGEELIGLIGRVFQQTVGTQLRDLGSRLAGLEGRVANTQQAVQVTQQTTWAEKVRKYEETLDAQIPGWTVTNDDPKFLDWLENVDTLSGKKYMDLLADAHRSADAGRVIHIFCLYKPDLRAAPPAAPAPTAPTPPAAPAPTIDPASLAAPSTSAPTPLPTQPPVGRIWTMAEVDRLYDRKAKGTISSAEFQREEGEYLKALGEGRVATA